MKGIVAVNKLGYIGLGGRLPWKSSDDLNHFKTLTMGGTLLVGSTTARELPFLPGRKLIVYNRGMDLDLSSIDWCIGGRKMYEMFMPHFNELHVSVINDYTVGDVKLPDTSNLPKTCKIFVYKFEINN